MKRFAAALALALSCLAAPALAASPTLYGDGIPAQVDAIYNWAGLGAPGFSWSNTAAVRSHGLDDILTDFGDGDGVWRLSVLYGFVPLDEMARAPRDRAECARSERPLEETLVATEYATSVATYGPGFTCTIVTRTPGGGLIRTSTTYIRRGDQALKLWSRISVASRHPELQQPVLDALSDELAIYDEALKMRLQPIR